MAGVLPDDFDDRLQDLHKKGLSATAIARELGCSVSTVSRHAVTLGLSFTREATAAATIAHQIDAAARRAKLIHRGYSRAEALYDRLEAATYTYRLAFKDFSELVTDAHPPAADERALQAAIGGHMLMVARLEAVDQAGFTGRGESLIDALEAGFAVAARTYTPPPA